MTKPTITLDIYRGGVDVAPESTGDPNVTLIVRDIYPDAEKDDERYGVTESGDEYIGFEFDFTPPSVETDPNRITPAQFVAGMREMIANGRLNLNDIPDDDQWLMKALDDLEAY